MPFLYFPEDKMAYIPATLTLLVFMILAGITMYWFYKKSKKEEQRFQEKFQDRLHDAKPNSNHSSNH